jgi:hypothetical protein
MTQKAKTLIENIPKLMGGTVVNFYDFSRIIEQLCEEIEELKKLNELTEQQKVDITLKMLNKEPIKTIGQMALLKICEMAIGMNSAETTWDTEATFDGKRYKCIMVATWEEKL